MEDIEKADNVIESTDEATVEQQPTPPVEQVDQTKAFATRLKEEKAKLNKKQKKKLLIRLVMIVGKNMSTIKQIVNCLIRDSTQIRCVLC